MLQSGIEPDSEKIEVIEVWGIPTNRKGVKSLLDAVGFYRRCVKDFAKIAIPVTELTAQQIDMGKQPDGGIPVTENGVKELPDAKRTHDWRDRSSCIQMPAQRTSAQFWIKKIIKVWPIGEPITRVSRRILEYTSQ